MTRSENEVDQIVFRWDSENASGSTGFGPVAWSGPREQAQDLFRISGPMLRASGEETRPALIRLHRRPGVMLIRRTPFTDADGSSSVLCHALVGSPALLEPAVCLGLHAWNWDGADVPYLAGVRGRMPVVREEVLVPSTGQGQGELDETLPYVVEELTGAVAEFLRNPDDRFTVLDARGSTACPVLWGLHSMFGALIDRRWTFASHDTAELPDLRFVFVGRWSGAASPNTGRRRVDPRERTDDRADETAARLVRHHLRGVEEGGGREYAVGVALHEAASARRALLLDTATRALDTLDTQARRGGPPPREPRFPPGGKPGYGDEPAPRYESTPDPRRGSGPGRRYEPGPEPRYEPGPEPRYEPGPEPRYEPDPEPRYEPEPDPWSEAAPEPRRGSGPGRRYEVEPDPWFEEEPEPRHGSGPDPRSGPAPDPRSEAAADPRYEARKEPRPEAAPEPRHGSGPDARHGAGPDARSGAPTDRRPRAVPEQGHRAAPEAGHPAAPRSPAEPEATYPAAPDPRRSPAPRQDPGGRAQASTDRAWPPVSPDAGHPPSSPEPWDGGDQASPRPGRPLQDPPRHTAEPYTDTSRGEAPGGADPWATDMPPREGAPAPAPIPAREPEPTPAPAPVRSHPAPDRVDDPYPRPVLPFVGAQWTGPVAGGGRRVWARLPWGREREAETGLVHRLPTAYDVEEARGFVERAGSRELLDALRRPQKYVVVTLLLREIARRLPSWEHPARRELCEVVLGRELWAAALPGAEQDRTEPPEEQRASNAAELHRWAVRPLLGGGDAPVGTVAALLARLRTSPVPSAREAFWQIVDGDRPGLPDAVWLTLLKEAYGVRRTSPSGHAPPPGRAPQPGHAPPPGHIPPAGAPTHPSAPRAVPYTAQDDESVNGYTRRFLSRTAVVLALLLAAIFVATVMR
ncbi:hypothetical protein [Streptomyces gardneri]|uniref:hypothetical protein n=1 Tax=Streptomyces gardneri TaxID=66892 RepID=UPI0037CEF488